jgi:uncharacterized membrane protein
MPPGSPALAQHAEERASDAQYRVADKVAEFAGSLSCVYVHVVAFAVWIIVGGFVLAFDDPPFNWLAIVLSIEAAFLSTFVLIGQSRADVKRRLIADEHWQMVRKIDEQNRDLIASSQQILELVRSSATAEPGSPTD